MKQGLTAVLPRIFLSVNLVFAALLIVSAFGGYVNPKVFPWLVSATLLFPLLFAVNVAFVLMWLMVCSRRWLWSFLVLLATAFQFRIYCPINLPQPAPKGSVKVLTYNLFGYGGFPRKEAFADMMDFLANCDANICCLQEAYYSERYKAEIEAALSHWSYRDSVSFARVGNALMLCSDFPIVDRRVISSPSYSHVCVAYRLLVDADTIVVVNSHFVSNAMNAEDKQVYHDIITAPEEGNTGSDVIRLGRKVNAAGVKRAEQADSLLAYLETLGDVPVIVCGDFNDSPLSYVHHRLTRNLTDAYVASGSGPGISYHLSGMFFRLDNILCSSHWRSFGARVMSDQKMSDHYPLEAVLKRVR